VMVPVNAIMPVFRGGPLWENTLRSHSKAKHLFGQSLVSFDGPTRHQLSTELSESQHARNIDHSLTTPKVMTAMEHLFWMLNQEPITAWADNQLVTLLAEDDLICLDSFEAGLKATDRLANSMLFGSWQEVDGSPKGDVHVKEPESDGFEIVSESEIATCLATWVSRKEITSVSGMTFRLKVLRDFLRLAQGLENQGVTLSGVRAEYFLATQPEVKCLIRCIPPIVQIQIHEQQEGRIVGGQNRNQDEAIYQLWLMLTGQKMSGKERVTALGRLSKRLLIQPGLIKKIPAAWVVLWNSRNAS
jgi:hypothetical protein